MKLISLIDARPQIIKEAILNQELEKEGIEEILVHSGQHYDFNMSDVFFKVLNIKKASYNLGIGSGTHAEMTCKTMIEFEKVVLKENQTKGVYYTGEPTSPLILFYHFFHFSPISMRGY